jgi:hypothetical protein
VSVAPSTAPRAELDHLERELLTFIEVNEQEQQRKTNERERLTALITLKRDKLFRLESDSTRVVDLADYRTLRRQLEANRALLAKADEHIRIRGEKLNELKAQLANVRDQQARETRTATILPFRRN